MYTFIETKLFTRLLPEYLKDDEYADFQKSLSANPDAGDLIPGSGGVRKIRWGLDGKGKRGGLRMIYYLRNTKNQIWLLTLYPKSVKENMPAHILKKIKEEIDEIN